MPCSSHITLRFDFASIEAEYRRLGHDIPGRWLCTLQLAARLDFSVSRSLWACCANLGLQHDNGHAALVDAQAAARLLAFLLENGKASIVRLDDNGAPFRTNGFPRDHYRGSGWSRPPSVVRWFECR